MYMYIYTTDHVSCNIHTCTSICVLCTCKRRQYLNFIVYQSIIHVQCTNTCTCTLHEYMYMQIHVHVHCTNTCTCTLYKYMYTVQVHFICTCISIHVLCTCKGEQYLNCLIANQSSIQ